VKHDHTRVAISNLVLKDYTLKEGGRLTIGRHPDNDIVPKDAAVSNHHAIIERVGEKLIVQDKESRNGTFVNGIEVQSAELNEGDIVEFGNQLNLRVTLFSLKRRESAATEEHDDRSDVLSTIERTLAKL
jgi:pSer/pThr/pTyr-binding forkhead associated (FHA) protein